MNLITRKRALLSIALAGASALVLAGCGAAPEEGDGGGEAVDFTACAVSDEGSWNDKSFNEAAYDGLLKAEDELGVSINDAESQSIEDFEPNLTQMVEVPCDVTFAVGFNFSINDTIFTVADANPDSQFVWIDGWNQGQTNLKPITYAMEQSSYLAGYLSAAYSTTKVIGTYGGLDIPAVTAFMDGFYYGAKAYEAETGTAVTVLGRDPIAGTGTFTDPGLSFGDTEGAKSISAGFLAEGADVIFPVAGGLFASTAEAITESGSTTAVFLGVDKNIAVTSPEYADLVLTSVEKRMTQAVFDIISDLSSGGEFDVEAYVGTLENDGTALSDSDKISDELLAKLDELKAGIIDGSIDPLA
ncbi:BMP family protein [Pseudolysinimonas sp.]|uniref:BMP family protein n=1 Tax=Pseudolysinimonas sp. TaxID=2680009 RepID=UPI0037852A3D